MPRLKIVYIKSKNVYKPKLFVLLIIILLCKIIIYSLNNIYIQSMHMQCVRYTILYENLIIRESILILIL